MYLSYFGLSESPFSSTPDRRFVYLSARHREGLAHLVYGLKEQGGFVQLTGEVGTGKTTLCRYVLEPLPSEVDVALILNPVLTPAELLMTLSDELGVLYPPDATSLKPLVDALYRHLLDAHARGRRTVLIVDEAQHLDVAVLEQMRLLTNLETEKAKLLQIILIGQPELIDLLARTDLRQVAQRISARYHLLPLSARETRAYVLHRLHVAGGSGEIFDDAALRAVHQLSGGVPRVINVLCDRALLGAYATKQDRVRVALVRRAAREVFGTPGVSRRRRWDWRWTSVAAVLAGGLVVAGAMAYGPRLPFERGHRIARAVTVDRPATRDEASPAPANVTPAAEPPGTSVVPVAAAPLAPSFAEILTEQSAASSQQAAFVALYRRWGVTRTGVSCGAEAGELHCLTKRGTWGTVRRLNLPAILDLVSPRGVRCYVTVTGIDAAGVTLELGERRVTLPPADVDQFWNGAFTVLWRASRASASPIVPGARGKAVAWLRQRLAGIDGAPAVTSTSEVYDDGLKARVVGFQRKQLLLPDGIVGEETLVRLDTVLDPKAPSLSAPRS
jgi:general secretion pathway protein A